jgi:integrase/recombinase XerD
MDLQTFSDWLLVNGNSKASTKSHVDKIAGFYRQYKEFTQENLNSFLTSKLNVWCGNSFNININAIRHYAKFLKMDVEIPKYHRIDSRVKEYLEKKEFDDILIKLPLIFENGLKAQVILELMYFTGLRPKEVINLKREDINLQEKYLIIRDTKVKRDKKVVLSDSICKLLPMAFAQEAENLNALNITQSTLNYIFRTITKQMGLKKILTPYTMRISFAHYMLKSGLKINELQLAMNHKNISTTLGYLKVSETESNDAVRRIINKRRK